jgi:hypothetical protein
MLLAAVLILAGMVWVPCAMLLTLVRLWNSGHPSKADWLLLAINAVSVGAFLALTYGR